jgi:hypothetical protein
MSSPLMANLSGTFTSAGTALFLPLPSGYNEIDLINITDMASTAANTNVMKAHGTSSMPAGYANVSLKTSGAATIALEYGIATAGFTFISDTGGLALGASASISGITNAAPPVASATTTPLVGQIVRLYGTTAALQLAGIDYEVTAASAGSTFTIGRVLLAPGSAASAGTYRIVNSDSRYYPKWRFICGISAASSAIINTTVSHGFVAGQQVKIYVPSTWGMKEMNGLVGTITSVTAATLTVNIDSSAMTAFAYPTSAAAALGIQFPIVVPISESTSSTYANIVSDTKGNQSATGVWIGTGVQTTAKVYQWIAKSGINM